MLEAQRHMMRCQKRRHMVELRQSRTMHYVSGDRLEGTAAQTILNERGQMAARAALHKQTHPIDVHGLNHARELDRTGPVLNGQAADRFGVVRKALASDA